jgi:hypothetical protein
VFQNLSVEDMNNVHLVCRNLHKIANLQVNPRLRFEKRSARNLGILVQSSRIFEELEFVKGSYYLVQQRNFQTLEEYLSFAGTHVKKLMIRSGVEVDPVILQKLLNLLPNLRALEIEVVKTSSDQETAEWNLNVARIKKIRMSDSSTNRKLLESLNKCKIRELEYVVADGESSETLRTFLETQEKTLKRLTLFGKNYDFNLLVGLEDLRLEHLDFVNDQSDNISLDFLKQQVDLKSLRLVIYTFSDQDLSTICGLRNLESLQLVSYLNIQERSGLNQIYKLQKLRRLEVHYTISRNILRQLRFGVFKDLEELDAHFEGASLDSIQELSRITPNLKKLVARSASSDMIEALLDTLEHLESVRFVGASFWAPSGKVYPNIKYLHLSNRYRDLAEQFKKMFPNLDELNLS